MLGQLYECFCGRNFSSKLGLHEHYGKKHPKFDYIHGGTESRHHKQNCKCIFCKAKRGELKGSAHPMFGRVSAMKGKKMSKISRELMSVAKKKWHKEHDISGENSHMFGKHHSIQTIKKIRMARLKQVIPTKDTKIEKLIQNELEKRGYLFEKHYAIGNWQVDIAFPKQKLVIECDGDYWHERKERKIRDEKLNRYIKSIGWEILHFWEHEILDSPSDCVDKIEVC